jgi:hypothetical protein
MGYELACKATLGKQSADGKAQLETDFVQFKSDALRFKVLLKNLAEVKAAGENLDLAFDGKQAKLQLGEKAAAKWADKILNPPDRLGKLGVKPGTTVCLESGPFERAFKQELGRTSVQGLNEADLVFLGAPGMDDLAKVPAIAKRMRSDAGLWIVYPKGRSDIREIDVIEAGRAAGLKDVKVMRFSDTETALKFVVPVAVRKIR